MKKRDSTAATLIPFRPRLAGVIYRATLPGGREGALYPSIPPAEATMADAWIRWNGVCPGIDPRTLEIEIHDVPVAAVPERHAPAR